MAWLIWCVSRNTQKYILNWILFTIHIHSTYLSVKTCIPHHFTEFAIVFEFQLTESYSYVNLNKHQYLRIYVIFLISYMRRATWVFSWLQGLWKCRRLGREGVWTVRLPRLQCSSACGRSYLPKWVYSVAS